MEPLTVLAIAAAVLILWVALAVLVGVPVGRALKARQGPLAPPEDKGPQGRRARREAVEEEVAQVLAKATATRATATTPGKTTATTPEKGKPKEGTSE